MDGGGRRGCAKGKLVMGRQTVGEGGWEGSINIQLVPRLRQQDG